jgi:hypothetical protein
MSDDAVRLGTAPSDRTRIEREVGAGGAVPGPERFLQHPHLLPLFEPRVLVT